MEQIRKNLWLGNSSDAQNLQLLTASGIRAVLNVARDLDYQLQKPVGVILPEKAMWQHKVGLIDGPGNDAKTFIAAVFALGGFVESGRTCLAHCHQGRSRSPSVVAAYLAVKETKEFDDVLAELKSIREIVRPEEGILKIARETVPLLRQILN